MRTPGVLLLALMLASTAPAQAAIESFTVPVTEPAPAELFAEIQTPGGPGPHPTVILLHGCGGVSPNVPAWATWLRSEGYASVVLNSFGGRGLRTLCGDSSPLRPAVRAGDVFAALARLRTMGAVDAGRIAVMGFSHGGSTALAAWAAQGRHPGEPVRAFIAFYPGCRVPPPAREARPLLLLVGGRDDWALPEPCERLGEQAKTAGLPVSIVVYPDAQHHFDGAELKRRAYVSAARGGKGATIEYSPSAHADSEKQVRRFLDAQINKPPRS